MLLDLETVGRNGTKEQVTYQHVIIKGQTILISELLISKETYPEKKPGL